MTFWRSCSCLNAAAQVGYSVDAQMVLTVDLSIRHSFANDPFEQSTFRQEVLRQKCTVRDYTYTYILNYTYTNATFAHRQAS